MTAMVRIYNFVASRKLTVVLTIYTVAVLLIWLFPFQVLGVPKERVANMADDLPLAVALGVLLINNVFCMTKELAATRRRARLRHDPPEAMEALDAFARPEDYTASRSGPDEIDRLRRAFMLRGYRVRSSADGLGLCAVKGRHAPWGTILFHCGLLIIVSSILLVRYQAFTGEAVITEGQSWGGRADEYASSQVRKTDARILPDISVRVERVKARFWQDKLLFTDLAAHVAYPAGTMENEAVIRLGSPLVIRDAVMAITGFGYTPSYLITGAGGQVLANSFVTMNVFPPGTVDSFTVPPLPYKFAVAVYPDHGFVRGKPITKSFNLSKPLYALRVTFLENPKKAVWEGFLKPTQEARFDGYKISFPEIRQYGRFRIQRNHGLSLVFAGIVFGVFGLVLRLVWRRRGVLVRVRDGGGSRDGRGPSDGGTANGSSIVRVAAVSEYYPRLFRLELARMWPDTETTPTAGAGSGDVAPIAATGRREAAPHD